MRKLLSAESFRLAKSKVLRIGMAVLFFYGVYVYLYSFYLQNSTGKIEKVDEYFFNHILFMGILTAIFASLYVGTEYTDGTIRNKLIVGCRRKDIYLAKLVAGFLAGTFLWASYLAAAFLIGMPLLGFFKTDPFKMFYYMLCSLLLTFAYMSIMVLCSMLNANKALNAVLCILLALGLLLMASIVGGRLEAPEMVTGTYTMSINGEFVPEEPSPNPQYISGTKREVYEWILDILPSGQSVQITNYVGGNHPERWPVCSLLIVAVVTGTGLAVFERKDIR